MATVTNAVTSASVTEIINSEHISDIIGETHESPEIYKLVCDVRDARNVASPVYTFTREDAMNLDGSYDYDTSLAETEDIEVTDWGLSEVQVTASTLPARSLISEDAIQDSLTTFVERIVRAHARELSRQAEVGMFALLGGFTTNSVGSTGVDLSIATMGAAIAAYRALEATGGEAVMALSYQQVADLSAALRSASGAIYGSVFGGATASTLLSSAKGYLGEYEGFPLFMSGNVLDDATDEFGGIFSTGLGGAFGMPVWRQTRHRADDTLERLSVNLVSDCRYGMGISEPGNLVRIQSDS